MRGDFRRVLRIRAAFTVGGPLGAVKRSCDVLV